VERGAGILDADEEQEHEHLESEALPAAIQSPLPLAGLSATGLLILACFYTLYFARAFFMPVVLAVLLDFLLKPLVRGLHRMRVPEALGAAVVLTGVLSCASYGLYALSGPAAAWLARAPQSVAQVERKLREIRRPVDKMSETAEKLAEMADSNAPGTSVEVRTTGLRTRLLQGAQSFIVTSVAIIVLLYFLMASGDLFLRKLVRVLPTFRDKKRAVEIARETERHISTYLVTVTLVNAGLGVAVGTAVGLAGVPNPVLWGAMAGVLNFVPYLGATVGIGVLTVVSLLTFASPWRALLAPGLYLALQTIEGNFVTPVLLGRQFTLNPVMLFVCLAFWGFLWGIPGMLVAVPLLAIFKIICDHVEPLMPLGEFLAK
jgi:predicted PurR-regulated permease PerM